MSKNIRKKSQLSAIRKAVSKTSNKARTTNKNKKTANNIAILLLLLVVFMLYSHFSNKKTSFPADDTLSVCYLDVGQGDSAFITADNINMLIDCGESDDTDSVISYLQNKGIDRIDYVVGTHPHSDHMGGMSKIIDSFDIGEVIVPHLDDGDFPTSRYYERFLDSCDAKGISPTEAKAGRIIEIGDARAEIIAPISAKYGNINNYSIGIYLNHGENSFMFSGDAEKEAEKEMVLSGSLGHADVYKVGHHGSNTSSSKDFLDIIKPDYAVISCGAENSYGHPHREVMDRLLKYTQNIYRTDLHGNIIFESDGKDLKVSTEEN